MRRRNKLRTCLHIVWSTKNRLPLITPDIERRTYACTEKIFKDNSCAVLAINGMPDHIHALIVFPTTISLATLMGRVKGMSSSSISADMAPDHWFAWQANYAVFAVSESHKDRVKRYIANQKNIILSHQLGKKRKRRKSKNRINLYSALLNCAEPLLIGARPADTAEGASQRACPTGLFIMMRLPRIIPRPKGVPAAGAIAKGLPVVTTCGVAILSHFCRRDN